MVMAVSPALSGWEALSEAPSRASAWEEPSTWETVWLADSVVDTAVQPVSSSARAKKMGKIRFIHTSFLGCGI